MKLPVDDLAKCNETQITHRDGVSIGSITCLKWVAIDTFWRFRGSSVLIVFVFEEHAAEGKPMFDGDLGRPPVVEMRDQVRYCQCLRLTILAHRVRRSGRPLAEEDAPERDVPSGKKPLPDRVAMYPTSPSAMCCSLSMSAETSSFRGRSPIPGFWAEAWHVQTARTSRAIRYRGCESTERMAAVLRPDSLLFAFALRFLLLLVAPPRRLDDLAVGAHDDLCS